MPCPQGISGYAPGSLSRKCSHGSGWLLLAQMNISSHKAMGYIHDVTVGGTSSQSRIKSVPTLRAVTLLAPGSRLRDIPPHGAHVHGEVAYRQVSAPPLSPLKAELGGPPHWIEEGVSKLGPSGPICKQLFQFAPEQDRKSTCSCFGLGIFSLGDGFSFPGLSPTGHE